MRVESLIDDNLDGVSKGQKYPDGTAVRVFCMQTDRDAYPSGCAYKLHCSATDPDPPRTLADGTIRRYDNSHEGTKGHELHIVPEVELEISDFPAMVELWERFWNEIPKPEVRNPKSRSSEAIITVIFVNRLGVKRRGLSVDSRSIRATRKACDILPRLKS